MSGLIVHGAPQSTFARSVRLACHEKGIDYALDPIGPGQAREQGLHPFGKIPAITHGDLRLFETQAILAYLDETFEGPVLYPADRPARFQVLQWSSAICDKVDGVVIRRYVLPYVFPKGADGAPDRSVIDASLAEMSAVLAALDEAYGTRDFLVGDSLTAADLLLAPIMAYLGQMPEGPDLLGATPNLQRGAEAMQARESFQATVPPARPS